MVAAAGVGNITLAHGPSSASLREANERRRVELGGLGLARGDRLGAFGSVRPSCWWMAELDPRQTKPLAG